MATEYDQPSAKREKRAIRELKRIRKLLKKISRKLDRLPQTQ